MYLYQGVCVIYLTKNLTCGKWLTDLCKICPLFSLLLTSRKKKTLENSHLLEYIS